jgi:hypothetical protein
MNKRWWITIIVIVAVLIVIGILYDNGMLNFKWTGLTMLFAALAGPYMFVKNWLLRNREAQDILGKHEKMRADEKIHRKETDDEILKKEQRIKDLNKDIELSEKKIQLLEEKKKNVVKDVKKMSIEETQDEAINYFGS